MLVVSRKSGESLRIGEDIKVHILEQTIHGTIKIGIQAPKSVKVLRGELQPEGLMREPEALDAIAAALAVRGFFAQLRYGRDKHIPAVPGFWTAELINASAMVPSSVIPGVATSALLAIERVRAGLNALQGS